MKAKKVRIVMEADISDLPAFNDGLAGQQNLFTLLNFNFLCATREKLMESMCREKEMTPVEYEAVIRHNKADVTLAERLMEHVDIKVE